MKDSLITKHGALLLQGMLLVCVPGAEGIHFDGRFPQRPIQYSDMKRCHFVPFYGGV